MHRRPLRALAASSLVLILTACTTDDASPPDADPPDDLPEVWVAEFDRVLADEPLNDFERDILADYRITDAEYRTARDAFRQCAEDAGFDVSISDKQVAIEAGPGLAGTYANDDEAFAALDEIFEQCEFGTTRVVGRLYESMASNPQGLTTAEEIRACYERHDVPDGVGMSQDEFDRMVYDPAYEPSTTQARICFLEPRGTTDPQTLGDPSTSAEPTVTVSDT